MSSLSVVDYFWGLLLLFIIVLVPVLVANNQALSYRNSFLDYMKRVQRNIRHLQAGIYEFKTSLKQSQFIDRAPYLERMKGIQIELVWLEKEFYGLRDQYIQLQEISTQSEKSKRFHFPKAIFHYAEIISMIDKAKTLESGLAIIEKYFTDIQNHLKGLAELGWEIAGLIREALEQLNSCDTYLQTLIEQNVHGAYIDEAILFYQKLLQKTSLFPQEIIYGSKSEIIESVSYSLISQAYETYLELNPQILNLYKRVSAWKQEYDRAVRIITDTHTATEYSLGLLLESREKIDLEDLIDHIKTVKSISDILNDTLNRVEIESLSTMMEEADRIRQIVEENTDIVKQARRNQSIFEPLLGQIVSGMKQINDRASALRNHKVFPFAWDISAEKLLSLSHRQKELSNFPDLRSPEQIQDHLNLALNLYKEIVDVSSHIKQVEDIHHALVSKYQTEEIDQGLFWCQEAQKLLEQALKFNPLNYPDNFSVYDIANNLENMRIKHQTLLKRLTSIQVCESNVQQLFEETSSLYDEYIIIQEQVSEVKGYLILLREQELQIRESLQDNRPILNQLGGLVRSSPILMNQGAEKTLDRMQKDLDTCFSNLDDVSYGIVDNKRLASEALDKHIETACNQWSVIIDKHVMSEKSTLKEKLNRIENIVILEDPVVKHAHRLLSRVEKNEDISENSGSGSSLRHHLVLELRIKNEQLENLISLTKELEETIEKPIIEAYHAVLKQKELAENQLLKAKDHIPDKRSWPPISIVFATLKSELEAIDNILRKEITLPMRAIWWVRRFSEISVKYQEFILQTVSVIETCQQERQMISELESRFDHVIHRWAGIEHELGNDRLIAAKIRTVTKDYIRQYKQIKRRWQFSGSVPGIGPSYEEIRSSLNGLIDQFETGHIIAQSELGESVDLSLQVFNENSAT